MIPINRHRIWQLVADGGLVALEGQQADLTGLAPRKQAGLQLDRQGLHLDRIQAFGLGVGQHEGQGRDGAVAAGGLPAMLQVQVRSGLHLGRWEAPTRLGGPGDQNSQARNSRHEAGNYARKLGEIFTRT